jgi:tetratricopeptide (TPR) repeat protein
VQEGDLSRATEVLEHALALSPQLARANFFYAKVLREEGRYDDAIQRLDSALKQYPQDRVVLNDLARVYLLKREYQPALNYLARVFAIDPEDLQGHYDAMLCYQGLGQAEQVSRERALYLRFKADESAQTITGGYRESHPFDNNERQPIHAHDSAPLNGSTAAKPGATVANPAGGD